MQKKTTKKTKANPVKVEANFLLVIAITTLVALALNFIAAILHNVPEISKDAVDAIDYASYPAGVASLVFTILNFTKWKVVRDKTKINYHFVTVGYIIPLALSVALGIVLAVFMQGNFLTDVKELAHTIIHAIALPIDLFTVIYSFILQSKVREYAK